MIGHNFDSTGSADCHIAGQRTALHDKGCITHILGSAGSTPLGGTKHFFGSKYRAAFEPSEVVADSAAVHFY